MLKRIYIVISLLSIATIMQGMEEELGKRSAGGVLNDTLDIVVGKVEEEVSTHAAAISGTVTTIEHELGVVAQEAKEELTLLGVTPKGAYEAAVVFGALYLGAETIKYVYNRYFAPEEQPLDPFTLSAGKAVDTANSNVHVLGQFVSAQQVNSIVEAKWLELMKSSKFADKDYVDVATKQIRNMVTSALETTASRVTTLEGQFKGLAAAINGDTVAKKTGILTAHDILANRIAALENQKQSASSSSSSAAAHSTEQEKGGGMMSKIFGGTRRKKGSDSAVHGVGGDHGHGDGHSQADGHENDDRDGATIIDLHAANQNTNNNNNNNNNNSDKL